MMQHEIDYERTDLPEWMVSCRFCDATFDIRTSRAVTRMVTEECKGEYKPRLNAKKRMPKPKPAPVPKPIPVRRLFFKKRPPISEE